MGEVYPTDMTMSEIVLVCDPCGTSRCLDRRGLIRETACYMSLDVALFLLSRGCARRDGRCELRFANVPGAGKARSIVVRRGKGWTWRWRHRLEGCIDVFFDGWHVGTASVVGCGFSQGFWCWNTSTQPILRGMEDDRDVALEAIKSSVAFGVDGLPETATVFKVRRAQAFWGDGDCS